MKTLYSAELKLNWKGLEDENRQKNINKWTSEFEPCNLKEILHDWGEFET